MTHEEFQKASTELSTEVAMLRERLHYFENLVHDRLNRDTHEHFGRINNAEKHIRDIVLRLVELEREQIELNIAKAL